MVQSRLAWFLFLFIKAHQQRKAIRARRVVRKVWSRNIHVRMEKSAYFCANEEAISIGLQQLSMVVAWAL
jgi:hypothetical protein